MIKTNFSHYSVSVLGSTADSFIFISTKTEYSFVADNALLSVLNNATTKYSFVFGKKTFSGLGEDVRLANRQQILSFNSLRDIVKGHTHVVDSPGYEDAKVLYDIIKRTGTNMLKNDYNTILKQLSDFQTRFDLPENTDRLTKLNLTTIYALFKTKNEAFKTIYFQQYNENAQLRTQSSASEIREELEEALRNYYNYVYAMRSTAGWSLLYAELNEVLKSASNTVTKPAKPTDETTPDEPQTPGQNTGSNVNTEEDDK